VHPVAVEFEFVQPLRSVRRLVDELGELRFDPAGECRRFGAAPWESIFPARDVNAPFGIRTAIGGMCSNESGIEKSRMFIGAPAFVRPDRDRPDTCMALACLVALESDSS
jgi:hypothetical protein